MSYPWPTAEEARELSVEDLAIRVLHRLYSGKWHQRSDWPNRSGQISAWTMEWATSAGTAAGLSQPEILRRSGGEVEALAEAWEWLRNEGLIARAVIPGNPTHDAYFVTRYGVALLETDDPLGSLRARRRLGLELHPTLANRLQPLVRAGAFEQAAFDALRQVEVRVRQLAGDPTAPRGGVLHGVALMQYAFGDAGPLSDPRADGGERRGLRELFAGAFGAVRNPLGHRNVEWGDPTEAAEMVLLADLLMRQLDRVELRAQQPPETSEAVPPDGEQAES